MNQTNKLPLRLRTGKKIIHGGYSFMRTGEIPQGPGMKEIERYLTYIRESFVSQLTAGGQESDLTAGQLILINKVTTLEGCQRLVEVDAAKSGNVKTLNERYNARNGLIVRICTILGVERGANRYGTPAEDAARQTRLIKAELREKEHER